MGEVRSLRLALHPVASLHPPCLAIEGFKARDFESQGHTILSIYLLLCYWSVVASSGDSPALERGKGGKTK